MMTSHHRSQKSSHRQLSSLDSLSGDWRPPTACGGGGGWDVMEGEKRVLPPTPQLSHSLVAEMQLAPHSAVRVEPSHFEES